MEQGITEAVHVLAIEQPAAIRSDDHFFHLIKRPDDVGIRSGARGLLPLRIELELQVLSRYKIFRHIEYLV